LREVESIINDWKTDVVEPIIKVNDLDKITNSALQLSKILYHDDLDLEKNLHDIRILQRELNDKVKERSKKEIVNRPTQIIEIINEFMFKEKEFRSNIHDYQNPMNNFLNVVLQKRIGIPITLSIIYISLGNSINFRLYPINFPGHFLVKHILDENRNEIIIDPFNQGRIMDDYSLKNILDRFFPYQKILVTKSLLEKTTLSHVIIRLLNNLKESFFEIQEFERLNIANEMILCIDHQNSHAIRDKGIILYNENPQEAEKLLIKYLELEPEANDADSILNTIKNLRGRKDF